MTQRITNPNVTPEYNNFLLEAGYKQRVYGIDAATINFSTGSCSYKYFYFNKKKEAQQFCEELNEEYCLPKNTFTVFEVEKQLTQKEWASWEEKQKRQKEEEKQKRLENEAKRVAAQGLTVEEYRAKKAEERKAKAKAKRIQEIKEEIAKLTKELEELEKI